ncbi:MAG: DUF6456 domain-containing protein [Sphingopyxis sp.]|uniref:DUF6456 domain-containing protein n=1 Tax=Sphingopyxis sp. TaxID=1908224 RepID=UPI004036DB4A
MTARRLETHLHPDDRIDPGKAGPQVMRHVTVNVGESPIAWLASRGLLTDAQLCAGERLRADYERAGLADICWRVICAGEGIGGAEKALGWPARSGKLVLGLALDRLARFYGTG